MKPLRVCQLITELGPAGAERCVLELARRLDRRRFAPRVAALRGGAVADELRAAGVPTAVLGVRGKWDVFALPRLARLLRRWRVDLLHTHLFHADLAGRPAAALAGAGHLVHTVHVAEARWRPWQFTWARRTDRWCDRVVCVSAAVRNVHARASGLPVERYTVIPNGIDASAYVRDPAAGGVLRRAWGVRPGESVVAFVGRLDPQKGVDTLLDAWDRLPVGRRPMLVIAGDGPLRRLVERRAAGRAGVRVLGHVRDVRGLLSAADVLAMPSRWEGFGLAAAEAMAAELPVVAARVPGLAEVVGEAGVLVPPGHPQALAAELTALLADPDRRRRLGAAGLRRVREKYSLERMVSAHELLYEELTHAGR